MMNSMWFIKMENPMPDPMTDINIRSILWILRLFIRPCTDMLKMYQQIRRLFLWISIPFYMLQYLR